MTIAPEAVEYYTKTYGVSEAEARARLVDQGRVIDPQSRLEQIDKGVGLVWYDNQKGIWAIGAPEAVDEAALREELSRLGLNRRSELRPVASSAAAMRAAAKDVADRLRDLLSSGNIKFGLGAGRLDLTLSSDIDAADARRAEQQLDEAIERETASRDGAGIDGDAGQLTVRRSTRESLAPKPFVNCTFPNCDEMLAGVNYVHATSPGYYQSCTTAFYVGKADHWWVYDPYMLTAGHCLVDGRAWGAYLPNWVGKFGGYQTNRYFGLSYGWGGGDGGLLRLTNNAGVPGGWGIRPRFWHWSANQYVPVRYGYTQGPVPEGTVMCKSGRTTGTTCGTIRVNNAYYGDLNGMLESTAYGSFGDSGGPWMQANLEAAIGMTSGGSPSGCCLSGEPLHRALAVTNTVLYGE